MRPVFLLAGVMLILSGIIHLGSLITNPSATLPAILMGLVSAAYLVLGVMLWMRRDAAVAPGIFVPLVGLLLVVVLMPSSPLLAVFIALDLVAIACCAYLYHGSRATIGRVR